MAELNYAEKMNIGYENEYSTDAMTGGPDKRRQLYYQLIQSMKKAESVDIIVSFLMESGVKMLLQELENTLKRGAKIRILTGNYLGITQPSALYLIKRKLGDRVDLRFYCEKGRSFHPKSYIFHYADHSELYIGSSNISRSALTSGIEWNYRFSSKKDPENYAEFFYTFEDLFENHSIIIDDKELKRYSQNWHRPAVAKDLDKYDFEQDTEDTKIKTMYEPRGAQIEALCALEDTRAEALPIGAAEAAAALQTLQRYKAGKAALDKRLIDNELWFRMGHWKNYRDPLMPGKAQPSSGWLFNSIANKHADAMDNYPEPMVLPRAADDQATAQALSSVLPVVLEQADYEQVYSDVWWRKLKQGTGVTGIFWDPAARGGLGDIAVRSVNLLMLYWEPGVQDIQDSPDLFHLSLEDTARLTAQYPQLAGHAAGVVDVPRYIHEDGQTTANKSVVVDWYYKRPDESGKLRLHYCKLCNGVVLYASQNDPALAARGLYDHGKYPFVFDPLFVEEDSPAGFGYIDVMKDCQNAIDRMNHAMDENVLLASRQRYVLSDTAGVNEEELADLSRDIVHVVGRLNEDSFRPLQTAGLQGNSLSYRNSRIEELKEISGNRDLTQGGTTGGVTAASAIAALQEAGSKLSRDMLKSAYRAFARQCYLIIELMRQFYDEQRVFRITGQRGESEFVPFSAQGLRAKPVPAVGGVELGSREPVFDIVVSAAKKSTFSRLSQNETAKECYKLGFFDPANADAALAALEMMDFEGVEKVRARVRQNGTLAQQLLQLQGQMARLSAALAQQPGGTQAAQDTAGLTAQLPVAAAARAMNWNGKEVK